jgi:hypothetical protein
MKRALAIAAAGPRLAILAGVICAGGCGDKLQGFGGPPTPLVTFQVLVSGDLASVRAAGDTSPTTLQVALVWGAQWLTEPFCILPPENPDAAAVIAAGCRDPFGFVPVRVAADVPVEIGTQAPLSLLDLPAADVMVGSITARVAYGTMVVYDDRNNSGTLELATPHRTRSGFDEPGPVDEGGDSPDVIYGASFLTMTAFDQRVAFREGDFIASAFYPRSGCPDPAKMFSVIHAGGFSAADGLASAVTGVLPPEDPASCTAAGESDPVINVTLQPPALAQEVSCDQPRNDSSVRYREPPTDAPNFDGRVTACAHLPSFEAGSQSSLIQLVVSGRSGDRCKGLTHYTLRGCRENVACPVPDWDFTATPPAWWPCPQ